MLNLVNWLNSILEEWFELAELFLLQFKGANWFAALGFAALVLVQLHRRVQTVKDVSLHRGRVKVKRHHMGCCFQMMICLAELFVTFPGIYCGQSPIIMGSCDESAGHDSWTSSSSWSSPSPIDRYNNACHSGTRSTWYSFMDMMFHRRISRQSVAENGGRFVCYKLLALDLTSNGSSCCSEEEARAE